MSKDCAILALNTGSSSLKFCVFKKNKELLRGEIENLKTPECFVWAKAKKKIKYEKEISSHYLAVREVIEVCEKMGFSSFTAVTHRLVFGGKKYLKPVKLTSVVIREIQKWSYIAPLHIPQELKVIKAVETFFPKMYQVGCFDTSFHDSMPGRAKALPIPKVYGKKGIHRYGFHGLSYEYICRYHIRSKKRVIIAHLGSGVSLCAIKDKKSFDTTMGLTPLGGIMMGTRPGDLDPGVLLYLLKEEKVSPKNLEHLLNHECGLKGVSNFSSNMLKLLQKEGKSKDINYSIEMFCYEIAKQIGAFVMALEGIDAIIFTGGIGARSSKIRKRVCDKLKFLDVKLDATKNKNHQRVISKEGSKVCIYTVETNEERILADHAFELLRM